MADTGYPAASPPVQQSDTAAGTNKSWRDQLPAAVPQHREEWPGPRGQFQPHRIIWSILMALWHSLANTGLGAAYLLMRPRRSLEGLYFSVTHPRTTAHGVYMRASASLEKKGVVYTVICAICMLVLPGGGFFGKLADMSEYGRKARETAEAAQREEAKQR